MRGDSVPIEWPAGGEQILQAATRGAPIKLTPILLPIEMTYRAVMHLRNAAYDSNVFKTHRVAAPVISVGNIVAGGAGKTPVTRYLTDQLLARGRKPAILHGGFGSDEPRLHHQWHPNVIVIAAKDRVRSANRALARGADVILLDDAFQHRRLARDLDIVLLSAESTNTKMLPRGPGREAMHALQRSNFILVTRKSAPSETAMMLETRAHRAAPGTPTARAHLRLANTLPEEPMTVVASIARPDVFLEQLQDAGAEVTRLLAYPDHYEYTPSDCAHIMRRADRTMIVTTAKDAVKLRAILPEMSLHVVEQELVFESSEEVLMTALDNVL